MKLSEKGKYMKIKHSVSCSPTKYGELFLWKSFALGTNLFRQIYGGIFYMGTNDQIMQGRKLMVKRFQSSSQVSFPLIDPDLSYRYIIWKINTTNMGLNLKNTFWTLCAWGWRFHVKPVFFLKKILVMICSLMSWL